MSINNDDEDEKSVVNLINNYDWASTYLGSMDSWEPSFKTAVNLCIHSIFPFAIYCGPDLIFIYNKAMISRLGSNHPVAFGKSFLETFPDYIDFIKPKYEQIRSTGKGIFENDCYRPHCYEGYLEERYLSFAISPIFKEDGSFWGATNLYFDTTDKILTNRRLKLLGSMGNHISGAESLENACHLMMTTLSENNKDIPFALIYLVEHNKLKTSFQPCAVHLIAATFNKDNIPDNLLETPGIIDLSKSSDESYDVYIEVKRAMTNHLFLKSKTWPIHLVVREDKCVKVLLKDDSQAILFPVKTLYAGEQILSAIFICGISPHRPLDEKYEKFLQLVVDNVSSALLNGRLREEEKKKTEMLADLDRQKVMFFQNISHEFLTPLTLMLSPLDEAVNSCQIYLDHDMFETIFYNLCSNAFKHTWEGQIRVRLYIEHESEADKIILEVSDTGIGIAETVIPNLFQRFYRVESQQSRSHEDIDEIATNENVTLEDRRYQVLLVEDNVDMRNYLEGLLGKEFDVYSACDGRDALNLLSELSQQPDLILSDVMMPNMNGYELLNTLRSNKTRRLIPLILLTAKADEIFGFEYGANDYLIKPFNSQVLIARIRTNIKLSQLRHQLISQQCKQEEIKQLLISISSDIICGLDLKETLSRTVESIHHILSCDRIFVVSNESSELNTVIALSEDPKMISENLSKESKINTEQESVVDQQRFSDYDSFKGFKVEVSPNTYCSDIGKQVSMLSVRIKSHDENWVWLKAHRSPNSIWDVPEIELFRQISNQINLAITYTKLVKEKLIKEIRIESIKNANNIKSLILANVSHELRTPLGAIMGISSTFKHEILNDQQRDMVDIISHISDQVLSIVNNILNAAELKEDHEITLVNKAFNLLDLFENTIEIFGERCGNKQIELILSYEMDSLPIYVKSDPERLKQILINLLSNAIKYSDGEIILKVSLKSQNGKNNSQMDNNIKLLIELYNIGVGIDTEFINIWQGNLKVDTSCKRRPSDTTFSLTTCKRLIEINGGEIGAESQLGKGSKYWFTWNIEVLPISEHNTYLSQMLLDEPILKRILLIHPFENSRNEIINFFNNRVKVDLFNTYDQGIKIML
ncbi:protein-histidine kinase [Gigaspora margarita]|uniref:Protein-histidine kinase n=1 Tax=Gigaspora margarita TaxID=4874 RepID=A0A8H4ADK6_GIGMA|nr:protein-histidine kinase [Gigaspora margarita]